MNSQRSSLQTSNFKLFLHVTRTVICPWVELTSCLWVCSSGSAEWWCNQQNTHKSLGQTVGCVQIRDTANAEEKIVESRAYSCINWQCVCRLYCGIYCPMRVLLRFRIVWPTKACDTSVVKVVDTCWVVHAGNMCTLSICAHRGTHMNVRTWGLNETLCSDTHKSVLICSL